MKKEELLEKFADRASNIIKDTDGIGWGLSRLFSRRLL
jgi:hypothetical protein